MASEFETELFAARKKISALKRANMDLQRKAHHTAKESHKEKRKGRVCQQGCHEREAKQNATVSSSLCISYK